MTGVSLHQQSYSESTAISVDAMQQQHNAHPAPLSPNTMCSRKIESDIEFHRIKYTVNILFHSPSLHFSTHTVSSSSCLMFTSRLKVNV